MGFQQYNEKKLKVIQLLERVNEGISDGEINQFINNKIANVEGNKFVISVFGNFSNGKSTMLNSLMGFGEEILVVDELASTATITKLKEPESLELTNKAEVVFSDGSTKLIELGELKTFSARNDLQEVETTVNEVTLYLDSAYLKNGIEIVDTPGFNSTYTIHTEIAKNYVEKSDASIFLFAFDKPGSDTEIKFLKYINQYMNRIFFVVNKIDVRNKEANSLNEGMTKLRSKLIDGGIEIGDKKLYPVSAKLYQEGIRENASKKLEESLFSSFTDELAQYLTSEENTRDRLVVPLEVISHKIAQQRALLQDHITACNKDQSDLMQEIKQRQNEIEEKRKILKEKKKHIQNTINDSIRNTKSTFQKSTDMILEEVKGELSDVKSEFDAKLTDFSSLALGVYDKFLKKWNNSRELLENDLRRLIEENVDDLKTSQELEAKLIQIIHMSLELDQIEIDDPKFDFEELKSIDEEMEKSRKEYERNKEKLRMSLQDKRKFDELEQKVRELKTKVDQLEERKDRRLDFLGEPMAVKTAKMVEKRRDREGFFGKIGNFLFGQKSEYVKEEYIDTSSVTLIEEQRTKVEKEFEIKVEEMLINREKIESDLESMDDPAFKQHNAEFDEKLARDRYLEILKVSDTKKEQLAKTIIRISKKNYINEIANICHEYSDMINRFLDKQKNGIVSVLNESIKYDLQEIEELQNSLFTITTLTNKTPDEINAELKSLTIKQEEFKEALEAIKAIKQEVL